jgi:hypothetical protein
MAFKFGWAKGCITGRDQATTCVWVASDRVARTINQPTPSPPRFFRTPSPGARNAFFASPSPGPHQLILRGNRNLCDCVQWWSECHWTHHDDVTKKMHISLNSAAASTADSKKSATPFVAAACTASCTRPQEVCGEQRAFRGMKQGVSSCVSRG